MTTTDLTPATPLGSDLPHPRNANALAAVARAARCAGAGSHAPASQDGCDWSCVELWAAAVTEVTLAALSALPADCADLV